MSEDEDFTSFLIRGYETSQLYVFFTAAYAVP